MVVVVVVTAAVVIVVVLVVADTVGESSGVNITDYNNHLQQQPSSSSCLPSFLKLVRLKMLTRSYLEIIIIVYKKSDGQPINRFIITLTTRLQHCKITTTDKNRTVFFKATACVCHCKSLETSNHIYIYSSQGNYIVLSHYTKKLSIRYDRYSWQM